MKVRIYFQDGTEELVEPVTGWGGEPTVPYTFEVSVGWDEPRQVRSWPLFHIRGIVFEDGV